MQPCDWGKWQSERCSQEGLVLYPLLTGHIRHLCAEHAGKQLYHYLINCESTYISYQHMRNKLERLGYPTDVL